MGPSLQFEYVRAVLGLSRSVCCLLEEKEKQGELNSY